MSKYVPCQHAAISKWLGPQAAAAAVAHNVRRAEIAAYGGTIHSDGTVTAGEGAEMRTFPDTRTALDILANEHKYGVECIIGADGIAVPKRA